MGLDCVGAKIYDIHGYFCELTVGQRTPKFWGITCTIPIKLLQNQALVHGQNGHKSEN